MIIKAGEVITQTIDLYKKNWQLFIKYAVLLLIPSLVVALMALFLLPSTAVPFVTTEGSNLIIYFVITLAASVFSLWFSIAFVRAIIARYEGRDAKPMKEEVMGSTNMIIPVILISLLVGLIVLGGALLLIVPGIIFSVWYAFTFYAVAVDGKGVTDSLGVSKQLVKGRWWGVLWRLLLPGLVFAIITSLASWIVMLPFGYLPDNTIVIALAAVVSMVVTMFFAPLSTTAPSILYSELKKNPLGTTPTIPETPTAPAEPPMA